MTRAVCVAVVSLCLVAVGERPRPTAVLVFKLPAYTEGVVFDRAGNGFVSSGKTIVRFALDGTHAVWAETGGPNGHKILPDGTHLVCDRSQKSVLHLSADGKLLGKSASECDGKPLRAPNDLTLDLPHGGYYFSDPEFSDLEHPIGTLHYVDADQKVHELDKDMPFPNGVALSADGKRLYLGDSLDNQIFVYDVLAPGKLGPKRVFAELPKADKALGQIDNEPDGICLDAAGNLYVAHFGMRRVEVLDPTGKLIDSLESGNLTTSNVAFGGPNGDQLFVTGALGGLTGSEGAVFRLDVGAKGQSLLPEAK